MFYPKMCLATLESCMKQSNNMVSMVLFGLRNKADDRLVVLFQLHVKCLSATMASQNKRCKIHFLRQIGYLVLPS
jgi:hypothetical protein